MTVTVVGMWEHGWLDQKVELFMFRQLRGAYKYDRLVMVPNLYNGGATAVDQYDTIEEALATCKGRKVFLEPTGESRMTDIPLDEDIVIIMGNAFDGNKRRASADDLIVRIDSPGQTDMFAVNAAAIVLDRLNERRQQNSA